MNKLEEIKRQEERLARLEAQKKAHNSPVVESRINSVKELLKSLKEGLGLDDKIKPWYMKKYKTDELGPEISDTATFQGLFDALGEMEDIYEYIFSTDRGDSIVRERLFTELANRMNVDYDVIYNKWLSLDESLQEKVEGKKVKNNTNALAKLLNKEYGEGEVKHEGNFVFSFNKKDGTSKKVFTEPTSDKQNKIKVTGVEDVKEGCEEKKNKLNKKYKKVVEGPGAGYEVRAKDFSFVAANNLEIDHVEEDEGYVKIFFKDNLDIDVTCHVEGESYYDGGIVDNAKAKIKRLVLEVNDYAYEDGKEDNMLSVIKDELYSLKTKSHQGGGWFHTTFTGLLAGTEDDIESSMSIVDVLIEMTDEAEITFLDRGIDDGNRFVNYVIVKDDETLDVDTDEESAIKKAKEMDADYVEAQGACQTEYEGDIEFIDGDTSIVWKKDGFEESVNEDVAENDTRKFNLQTATHIYDYAKAIIEYTKDIHNNNGSMEAAGKCASEIENCANVILNDAKRLVY